MITLQKSFTRDHSLFWNFIWSESETKEIYTLLGKKFNTILFLREPKSKKVSVWYPKRETDELYEYIETKILNEPEFFDVVTSEFDIYYKKLLPYFKEEKKIKTVAELEDYYNNFVHWWPPMAIVYAVPELKKLSKEIRDEALDLRSSFEKYSDKDEVNDFITTYFPQYKEIAKEMLPEEVFFLKGRELSQKEFEVIIERKNGFGLLSGTLYSFVGVKDEMKKRYIKLEEFTNPDSNILNGNVASSGCVTGKVRVLLDKKDIPLLLDGEVLVTEMTTPDFVPAIKKAAAIVTDEGGITCHASIVSRELKTPCIVGTKVATQFLKDGDLVEVDANKGIVKIIKD